MTGDEESLADVIAQMVARQAHEAGLIPPAPDELRARAATALDALRAKDGVRRFKLSVAMLSELLAEGPALLQGSQAEREADWVRCASSVLALWLTAVGAWQSGSPSVAAALSITCLEETGKLATERWRLWGVEAIKPLTDVSIHSRRRGRRPLFLDHGSKHILAAMSGALINARLDRVLGSEFITSFLDEAEGGRLEGFRQDCLYLDRRDGALHVPAESVTSEGAGRYVALSGEVLAEIQPDPGAWSRVLERVKEFEQSAGIDPA
jgi:AbiV family abortive infection protein